MHRVHFFAIMFAISLSTNVAKADQQLYGVFYNSTSPAGDSLTFAKIAPNGSATALWSWTSTQPGFGGGSLAYVPDTGHFALTGFDSTNALLVDIDPTAQTATEHSISGLLPLNAAARVYVVEYIPSGANTTPGSPGSPPSVFVSYGAAAATTNDRIARVDATPGANFGTLLQNVASGVGYDIDSMDYNPQSKLLTITDSNETIANNYRRFAGNIFGVHKLPKFADPAPNSQFSDGAFSPNSVDEGTYYVGSATAFELWKLNVQGGTDTYSKVGAFGLGTAVPVGLAYAVPEPATIGMMAMAMSLLLIGRARQRLKVRNLPE